MRVLLTGGTGYLGRAIARALAVRHHQPVLFARTASQAVNAGVPGEAIDGDVRDARALHDAATGCDAVCHTAALVTIWRRHRDEFDAINVGGLRNVLDAASAHNVPRVVYTSSFLALPASDADGSERPISGNDYQRTKTEAERVAAEASLRGAPLVRLYPGVVYGPGPSTEGNLVGRLVADHLRGDLPGIVGGDRTWSFAYVGDVANAHVTALECGTAGAAYALGGENHPQMRLFEIVRDLTGRRLPRRIPIAAAYVIGMLEELRAGFTNATPVLTRATLQVLRHDWALDSSRAIRDLHYKITPLRGGVEALLRSLQGH
jgi:farnesol dehydrogenase